MAAALPDNEEVKNWGIPRVVDWIEQMGYGAYKEHFQNAYFDGRKLLCCNGENLSELLQNMRLPRGLITKIFEAVTKYKMDHGEEQDLYCDPAEDYEAGNWDHEFDDETPSLEAYEEKSCAGLRSCQSERMTTSSCQYTPKESEYHTLDNSSPCSSVSTDYESPDESLKAADYDSVPEDFQKRFTEMNLPSPEESIPPPVRPPKTFRPPPQPPREQSSARQQSLPLPEEQAPVPPGLPTGFQRDQRTKGSRPQLPIPNQSKNVPIPLINPNPLDDPSDDRPDSPSEDYIEPLGPDELPPPKFRQNVGLGGGRSTLKKTPDPPVQEEFYEEVASEPPPRPGRGGWQNGQTNLRQSNTPQAEPTKNGPGKWPPGVQKTGAHANSSDISDARTALKKKPGTSPLKNLEVDTATPKNEKPVVTSPTSVKDRMAMFSQPSKPKPIIISPKPKKPNLAEQMESKIRDRDKPLPPKPYQSKRQDDQPPPNQSRPADLPKRPNQNRTKATGRSLPPFPKETDAVSPTEKDRGSNPGRDNSPASHNGFRPRINPPNSNPPTNSLLRNADQQPSRDGAPSIERLGPRPGHRSNYPKANLCRRPSAESTSSAELPGSGDGTFGGIESAHRRPLPPKPDDFADQRGSNSSNSSIDSTDNMDRYSWYVSSEGREYCNAKLKPYIERHDGCFVVRKSDKDPSKPYTLQLTYEKQMFHLPIRETPDDRRYCIGKEKEHETRHVSVPAMVDYHRNTPITLWKNGKEMGQTKLIDKPLRP